MGELIKIDDERNIDAQKEEIRKLEIDVTALKTKRHNVLSKSGPVGEIETSVKMDLNISRDAAAVFRSEINSAWGFINSTRAERRKKETAKQQDQADRVQDLLSRQNMSSDMRPKFSDALSLYSDDHLEEMIEKIIDEVHKVGIESQSVVSEMESLVSENGPTEIKDRITNLREFKATWVNLKFERISAREQGEYFNKEIHEKVELSRRKIALINHSV